jgi:hypothetical protein
VNVAELDEVQFDLELEGDQVREQLARRVWEKSGWATVAIAYREKARDGEWKPAKLSLMRFRRLHDAWARQASLTLSGDEALALAGELSQWFSAS